MALDAFRKPVVLTKLGAVALGILIMGIGLHSHFQSVWTTKLPMKIGKNDVVNIPVYKVCSYMEETDIKCPGISMERFFVAMVIISFFASIASLVLTFMGVIPRNKMFKFGDIGYHIIMGVLLISSAVLFMRSAEEINGLIKNGHLTLKNTDPLRRGEKLAAGFFGVVQGVLYGAIAFFVLRSD